MFNSYKQKRGMSLLEVVVVVIILGILAAIAGPVLNKAIINSQDREAQSALMLISSAEKIRVAEGGTYIACKDTNDCNTQLNLNLSGRYWNYSVTVSGGFCAQAERISKYGKADDYWHINDTDTAPRPGACP